MTAAPARRPAARRGAVALVVAVLAMLAGCGVADGVAVTRWQLQVADAPARSVELPTRLDLPPRPLDYTLTSTVSVPAAWRGRALTLSITHLPANARLWVGAVEVTALAGAADDTYRSAGPHVWRIPPELTVVDHLALRLDVAHRWVQSAWFQTAPVLSTSPHGDPRTRFAIEFTRWGCGGALGVLLTATFLSLLMFLTDRRRADSGWLALQLGFAMYYPASVMGATSFVGARLDAALIGLTLVVAFIASVQWVHAHFGQRPASWRWWLLLAANVVVAIVRGDPFMMNTGIAVSTVLTMTVIAGFDIHALARLRRRDPDLANVDLALAAWIGLLVVAVPDMLAWPGIIDPLDGLRPGATIGISLFGLLMFASMGRLHLITSRRLEVRQAEVEHLNDELRRQIAERSRQLAEALARLTAASPARALGDGEIIDGRYQVVRPLGRGAVGSVYEVLRLRDSARMALKILDNTSDTLRLARFAREAQLAAEVSHDNLVGVHDFAVSATGVMYLVMELVAGSTLKELRARFGEREFALDVLRGVADGLVALHAFGIIHRDLKPANVMVTTVDGRATAKIADFGISHMGSEVDSGELAGGDAPTVTVEIGHNTGDGAVADETAPTAAPTAAPSGARTSPDVFLLTQTGAVVGTPAYMAPELAAGQPVTPASDVFSFGVLAYELLTGDRPFTLAPAVARLTGKAVTAAASLAARRTDLDPALVQLIERSLAIDPAMRPLAVELAERLRAA